MNMKRKKHNKVIGSALHLSLSALLALTSPGMPVAVANVNYSGAGCTPEAPSGEGASVDLSTNPCESAEPSLAQGASERGQRSGAKYSGGQDFMTCQGKANVGWESIEPRSAASWEGYWKETYEKHVKSTLAQRKQTLEDNIDNNAEALAKDPNQLPVIQKQALTDLKNYLTEHYKAVKQILMAADGVKSCQSLRGLTDLLSRDDYKQAASWTNGTSKTSVDGKITCKAGGAETQDYLPCLNAINAYDALFVANAGVETVQQVSYMGKQMDIQQKMAEDTDSITAGMEAQKSNLEAQADIANQKAVFDGARAATLAGVLNSMPTREQLVSRCTETVNDGLDQIDSGAASLVEYIQPALKDVQEKLKTIKINLSIVEKPLSFDSLAEAMSQHSKLSFTQDAATPPAGAPPQADGPGGGSNSIVATKFTVEDGQSGVNRNSAEDICGEAATKSQATLLMNEEARQAMKAAMIAAGLDAAGNLAKAAILNKHADQIGDAINDVESFAPPEFSGVYEDGLFDECTADPDSENCGVSLSGQDVGFTGNTIQISGFDAGVIGGGDNSEIAAAANSDSPTSTSRSGSTAPKIGSAISGADKGGGITDAAAKATLGGGGAGGGSGGGGGGSPGSVAGPSGGGAPGGGGEQPAPETGNTSKISFSGGLKPSGLSGGMRAAAAKKESKVANPFDKLFGKKGAGNELSFRNPAAIGKGKGSVLEQISRRYSEISKTDRLLKYEKKSE